MHITPHVHHVGAVVTHPYALLGGGAVALVAIAVTLVPIRHPRWKVRSAAALYFMAGGLLLSAFLAVRWMPLLFLAIAICGVSIWTLWEWPRVQRHIPFQFVWPPVTWKELGPRVPPIPVALGKLDFEKYQKDASAAAVSIMTKIGKEIQTTDPKLTKQGTKIAGSVGKSVERRLRVSRGVARTLNRHAKKMGKLEAKYRVEIEAFVENSRELIEAGAADPDFPSVIAAIAQMRQAVVGGRTATTSYRNAIQVTRSICISQAVNGASEALIAVLDRLNADVDRVITYCDWAAQFAANQSSSPPALPPVGSATPNRAARRRRRNR